MHKITMLGSGLIGLFYTMTLHGQRSRDKVGVVYSRTEERASQFAKDWGIPLHNNGVVHTENDFPRPYRASRKDASALDRRFLYFDLAHGFRCRSIHYQDMLP